MGRLLRERQHPGANAGADYQRDGAEYASGELALSSPLGLLFPAQLSPTNSGAADSLPSRR